MAGVSIDQGVDLQALNTLAIPAKAAYCASCSSIEQLQSCLAFAHQQSLKIMVLGEGSNTVFTQDYTGLVVLNRLQGISLVGEDQQQVEIRVSAGESWHYFVEHSIQQGWFGLENLALIPGLVGAAPIQNIGAYGVEVKDFISSVEVLDLKSGELRTLTNHDCEFAYRESVFKHKLADKVIVTAVNFKLSKAPSCNLCYPALASELRSEPQPADVFEAVCRIRSAKLPSPINIPNAGSFFKNPVVSDARYKKLLHDYPHLVGFEQGDGWKLAAAWLIEQRGWKSKSLDGVKVHQQQALVVTNPQHRSGESVLALARAIQDDVKKSFSVSLEIEPRLY